jgi:hypothetical protein
VRQVGLLSTSLRKMHGQQNIKENSVVTSKEENERFSIKVIPTFGTSCDTTDAQSSSLL